MEPISRIAFEMKLSGFRAKWMKDEKEYRKYFDES